MNVWHRLLDLATAFFVIAALLLIAYEIAAGIATHFGTITGTPSTLTSLWRAWIKDHLVIAIILAVLVLSSAGYLVYHLYIEKG